MDLNNVRRASSAGYRLPERSNGTRLITAQSPTDKRGTKGGGGGGGDAVSVEQSPGKSDKVKQDQLWKELVCSERRGIQEWEKNWNFLKNYDAMGQLKTEEPLPSSVPLFSDRVPNTSNQMFGSRLSTPLGSELVRLDRLLLWSGGHYKSKQDAELMPC